jgi:hypothetical protein
MKFFAAVAFLIAAVFANPFAPATNKRAAAQAKYVSSLVSRATPTKNSQIRKLEEYEINLAPYSVKFEMCQFVKTYSDELAGQDNKNNNNIDTVLATKRFVLFRLCPDDCSSCSSGFGEYLVDLDSYLQYTVEYYQDLQEEMCKYCDENCYQAANEEQAAAEEGEAAEGEEGEEAEGGGRRLQYNVDCTTCLEECDKIENMEANGYMDASEFLECQMIYDPEDDNKAALYAGPMCANGGSKIKIGVFTDENCMILDASKEVDDYLVSNDGVSMKLSHALLKSTYTDTCISCTEPEDANQNNNGNDANDADQVIEMCEKLYDEAAKCETRNGFTVGYANYQGYENQLAQEEVVCDFMQSLKSGTYDEEGEIIISGSSTSKRGKSTTGGQKFALTFFILGTLGLAVYAAVLHSKLVKGGKSDLVSSGGAMA